MANVGEARFLFTIDEDQFQKMYKDIHGGRKPAHAMFLKFIQKFDAEDFPIAVEELWATSNELIKTLK